MFGSLEFLSAVVHLPFIYSVFGKGQQLVLVLVVMRPRNNSQVSHSSDQDSPPAILNQNFDMSAGSVFHSPRSETTGGVHPASGSLIPLECVRCPGRFRWECDYGHHTTVVHSPDCSSPSPLGCVGECRFGYSDIIVNTAKARWRKRKLTIAGSVMVVLSLAILGTLGTGVHYLSQLVAKTDSVQEVEPGQLVPTVTTALENITGQDTTLSLAPSTTLAPRSVDDPDTMSLPLEHPEYMDFVVSANGTVVGFGDGEDGDSYK